MLGWPLRAFRRAPEVETADPATEAAVAARLLPVAREVLFALGTAEGQDALATVERLAPERRTEVLCPPNVDADLVDRLLARQFVVYDAAAAPRRSALILDRRVGWRVPPWEPLSKAFQYAYRLLWTRLGYYTILTGTVDIVYAENRLFSFRDRALWVNAAYRDLPVPGPAEHLRVLGMFSYLASSLPIFHALRIERLDELEPSP
jgi:hypothetical protein